MRKYITLKIFMLWTSFSLAYDLKCPTAVNWLIKAKWMCTEKSNYICLYDTNNERYVEKCNSKKTFPKGHKAVIRDHIDIEQCSIHRYQPRYFSTNGQSNCLFEKSKCKEEGQIIYDNGTNIKDQSCTCDGKNDYTFATLTSSKCCVPTYEDCSCFKRNNKSEELFPGIREKAHVSNGSAEEKPPPYHCTECDAKTRLLIKIKTRKKCLKLVTIFIVIILTLMLIVLKLDCAGHVLKSVRNIWIQRKNKEHVNKDAIRSKASERTPSISIGQPDDFLKSENKSCKVPTVTGLKNNYTIRAEISGNRQAEISGNRQDVIPFNIREYNKNLIEQWKFRDKWFVPTCAFKMIEKIVQNENVVIVTGSSGTGKSFTAQHVMLDMQRKGYDIIPVATSSDIVTFFDRHAKQVFFIDDLCGRFNILNYAIEEWEQNEVRLIDVFSCPQTKCIFACRLQIYQDQIFKNLNLGDFKVVNLSGDHQIQFHDKILIAKKYLDPIIIERLNEKTITQSACFPLLCSLYSTNEHEYTSFFKNTTTVVEAELNQMKRKPDKLKYACIALCVMFNNNIPKDIFHSETFIKKYKVLRNVFEELEINIATPKKTLVASLESLVGSYLTKTESVYQSMHDYLFDIFCSHVSATMTDCVIKYGDSKLLSDRAILQSLDEDTDDLIILPVELEDVFFDRIMNDINAYKIKEVFRSYQMKYKSYRLKFMAVFINSLHTYGVNLNGYTSSGLFPLYLASALGYSDIVEMLCDYGSDVNQCTQNRISSLYVASRSGHLDCVRLLLDRGADVNKCDKSGISPIYVASLSGQRNIVRILCDRGGDVNLCSINGISPLYIACRNGRTDCVELLLDRNADVNKCDNLGISPLYVASLADYTNPIHILLRNKGDVDYCFVSGLSPFFFTSHKQNIQVIDNLLKKGRNVDKCIVYRESPLYVASFYEQNKIQTKELPKCKASSTCVIEESNYCDIVDQVCRRRRRRFVLQSSFHEESQCHLETNYLQAICVKMLLKKGAVVNQCNNDGASPLYAAAKAGQIDIIAILCKNGADVNLCTELGISPLDIATTGDALTY